MRAGGNTILSLYAFAHDPDKVFPFLCTHSLPRLGLLFSPQPIRLLEIKFLSSDEGNSRILKNILCAADVYRRRPLAIGRPPPPPFRDTFRFFLDEIEVIEALLDAPEPVSRAIPKQPGRLQHLLPFFSLAPDIPSSARPFPLKKRRKSRRRAQFCPRSSCYCWTQRSSGQRARPYPASLFFCTPAQTPPFLLASLQSFSERFLFKQPM